MEKIDLLGYGWAYEIILVLLFGCVVVDSVGIVKCIKGEKEDRKEYAELCIKYLKILFQIAAGAFFLFVCFTYGYEPATSAIHGILGALLIADAVVCLYIKIKYRRKKERSVK